MLLSFFKNINAKKYSGIFLGFLTLMAFNNMDWAQNENSEKPKKWIKGQILVQPKSGVSDDDLRKIVAGQSGKSIEKIKSVNIHIIQVPEKAEERVVLALSKNPKIKFAEKDYLMELSEVIPNDPRYSNAWHLPIIEAPQAWVNSKGDGVVVAVLDTGIDSSHPDLQGKLVKGWNSSSQNDDISDINGHGTRVAGTIGAATDNSIGVASVGWNTMVMPIRVTDSSDGYASWSAMTRGLTWAADNGAQVANMSYASWKSSSVATAAKYLKDKGGLAFASAGNDGTDLALSGTPHILVVSATGSSDTRTSWSNYGNYVDLTAPGASIQTTSRGGGYNSVSGTSFSSPIAAAVAGLIMSANPGLSPSEVESIILTSADDLGTQGWDPYYGHGRVNARRAVEFAMSAVPKPINKIPVAIASASTTQGLTPLTVQFSANNSYDPDGSLVAFEWLMDGKTVLSRNSSFSYTFNNAGNFQIKLTVTDNEGAIASDSLVISTSEPYIEKIKMGISELSLSQQVSRNQLWAVAKIKITDERGVAVSGANVSAQWSGLVSGTSSGTTNTDGYVDIASPKTKNSGTVSIAITNVQSSNHNYDESLNLTSSDSFNLSKTISDDNGSTKPSPGKGKK